TSAMIIARCWHDVLRRQAPQSWGTDEEGRVALELAVLFHDSGHLPFSHMMEEIFRELNWGHAPAPASPNIPRYRIDDVPDLSELEPKLAATLKDAGVSVNSISDWWKKVRAVQTGRTGITWLEAIADSAIDADKIEYI